MTLFHLKAGTSVGALRRRYSLPHSHHDVSHDTGVDLLTQIIKKIIISVQIASNAATTSMLVPVIKTLAIKLEVFAIWTFHFFSSDSNRNLQ